jgi:hypothetical protein
VPGAGLGAKVVASVLLLGSLVGGTAVVLHRSSRVDPPAATDADRQQATVATVATIDRVAVSPSPSAAVSSPDLSPVPISSVAIATELTPRARTRNALRTKTPGASPAQDPRESDSLFVETALLRQTQEALRAHDGLGALKALDEHAQRFPRGVLAEDRDAARVFALCELGRVAEAGAASAAFVKAHPRSPEGDRVRAACESKR